MSEPMKTINWSMSIGLVGCKRQGSFEIEADVSDSEIDEYVWDEVTQLIETNWSAEEKSDAR